MPKKTLNTVKETGNEAILQVKKNQPTLLKDCIETAMKKEVSDTYTEPVNKERNRIEQRTVKVYKDFKITSNDNWGNHIKAVIKVTRDRETLNTKTKQWNKSQETAYFISTVVLSAEVSCKTIRSHWGIENVNHYVKDVTLKEDKSRIRINPNIMARLRSFTLNVLRKNKIQNVSNALWKNVLLLENVFKYIGI